MAQTFFMREITRLAGRGLGKTENITIAAGESTRQGNVLLHNDVLLPDWRKFASALSSVAPADARYIKLYLQQVQIGPEVSDLLIQSLQTAPIHTLVLLNNGPGAVEFATRALETLQANSTFDLHMKNNPIESANEAASFARFIPKRPNDGLVALAQCGLGRNYAVMAAIVPNLLNNLKAVGLRGNGIGVDGARLISDIIVRNPDNLESLDLRNNSMGDDAAWLFAVSLKTNDRLGLLQLEGNPITRAGFNALLFVLICPYGLNRTYEESNHTCKVVLDEDVSFGDVNAFVDPHLNRFVKIVGHLVPHNANYTNMHLLDDCSVEMMPRVLVLLQGRGVMDQSKHNALSAVFRFIREWSLPLLYTSRRRPEHRRSERLRKKKVKELMAR